MKKIIRLIVALTTMLVILPGLSCKKDTDDADTNGNGDSFANTEYAGTAKVGNHYYPRPLSLRFDGDRNVSAWSNLVLNKYNRDVAGKVTAVEKNAQDETVLTVLWNLPGEEQFNSPQVYTISADKKTISGGNNPLYVLEQLPLAPKDVKSVVSNWAQPEHPDWYPDVNAIGFFPNKFAEYARYGDPVLGTPLDPDHNENLRLPYTQDGTRILFSGVRDEQAPLVRILIPYYGVLSADGNTIYLDALEYTYSRLPYSFSSFDYYGPQGVTPSLKRL
ncbi:MAG: hypothetical protein EOO05_13935 [Chitinophagaceae bacterium]|nr:MAG: hypothetical protein EOO05_13935 [Chitinophagaceae bacterium]